MFFSMIITAQKRAGTGRLGSENASSQLSTHFVHTFVAIWSVNVHSD